MPKNDTLRRTCGPTRATALPGKWPPTLSSLTPTSLSPPSPLLSTSRLSSFQKVKAGTWDGGTHCRSRACMYTCPPSQH